MAAAPAASSVATDIYKNRTYRVKHVPGHFDKRTLTVFLAGPSMADEEFGLQENITVVSLA